MLFQNAKPSSVLHLCAETGKLELWHARTFIGLKSSREDGRKKNLKDQASKESWWTSLIYEKSTKICSPRCKRTKTLCWHNTLWQTIIKLKWFYYTEKRKSSTCLFRALWQKSPLRSEQHSSFQNRKKKFERAATKTAKTSVEKISRIHALPLCIKSRVFFVFCFIRRVGKSPAN